MEKRKMTLQNEISEGIILTWGQHHGRLPVRGDLENIPPTACIFVEFRD